MGSGRAEGGKLRIFGGGSLLPFVRRDEGPLGAFLSVTFPAGRTALRIPWAGSTRPLSPGDRPTPFTTPLTWPRPLTTPALSAPWEAGLGRSPLTSPRLPRTQPERKPTDVDKGDACAGASASSAGSEGGSAHASGSIVSSSSSISQSSTAAFVSSSSSGVRDCSSSPTRRSSTSVSSSGAATVFAGPFAPGGVGSEAGLTDVPTSRAPHEGHKAISLGTAAPQLGQTDPASEIRWSSCETS